MQISFVKDCGRDGVCETDLHLRVKPILPKSRTYIVIGESNHFQTEVTIQCTGEAAYQTQLKLHYPKHLGFVRVQTLSTHQVPVTCFPKRGGKYEPSLTCDIANPLPGNTSIMFQITFDTLHVTEDISNMTIDMRVESSSSEDSAQLKDNLQQLVIPVKIHSSLQVSV